MNVSTVSEVIDYLVFNAANWMGSDVQVTDGAPVPPMDAAPNILCIGFTGTVEEPVAENTRTIQQLASSPDRESYDLVCIASSWFGNNTNMQAVRTKAYGIVNALADSLSRDATLGGLVMQVRVGSDSLAQSQTTKGAVATVRFNIHVEAFARRR